MLAWLDLMERATGGPFLFEEAFTLDRLIPNIQKTVDEFEVGCDPANPVPADDALARRLFEAAVDFIAATGVYCSSTNRVIELSRAEVLDAVAQVEGGGTFGEGRDRRTLAPRRPEDKRPPWCHVGTGTVASSGEIAMAQVQGYAGIPQASSVSVPALNRVGSLPAISGSPLEIYATIDSLQRACQALTRCGRPGLPIMNLIASATSSVATIAGSYPAFGLRPSDGWLIDFIAEMKVNFDTLNRLVFVLLAGGNTGSTAMPVLGGYAGGPAGTALLMTAYHLLGMCLLGGTYQLTGPIHVRYGCSTTRSALWAFAAAGRAISLHTRFPAIALGYAAAGPCTRAYFYESAAVNLACVPSGYAGIQTVHPAKAVIEDAVTPLEARFNVEMAYAATRVRADQASELVNALLARYEEEIPHPPAGKRIQECFDLESGKPTDEYRRLYEDCKEELIALGVPLLTSFPGEIHG
jgi:methylamine--corrinoid protein Co-methyltransferase